MNLTSSYPFLKLSLNVTFCYIAIKSFLLKIIGIILGNILPNKTKRLIFISSVVGSIKQVSNPDQEITAKLNQLLALSHYKDALGLPMYIHSAIWRKEINVINCPSCFENVGSLSNLSDSCLSMKQIRAVSNVIINRMPAWLAYGSRRQIREDLVIVIKNLPKINLCQVQ